MVQPGTEHIALATGVEDGSQLPELTPSSSSSDGEQPVLFSGASSATTGDGMSNVDEDSDVHSLQSHQDSMEPVVKEDDSMVSQRGVGVGGGVARIVSSTSVADSRPKRSLSEEERAAHGQRLRKACDMCTKVRRGAVE